MCPPPFSITPPPPWHTIPISNFGGKARRVFHATRMDNYAHVYMGGVDGTIMAVKKLLICEKCGNTRVARDGSIGTGLEHTATCRCGHKNTVRHFQNTFNDIRGKKDAYLILQQRINGEA